MNAFKHLPNRSTRKAERIADRLVPPYDKEMGTRVEKVEADLTAIKLDLAILKVNVANSATKTDIADTRTAIANTHVAIAEAKTSIILWVVGAIFLGQILPSILKQFGL